MLNYIIRRLLLGIIVLILVTVFVFVAMRLLPSDPVTIFISQSAAQQLDEEHLNALKHEYGLDDPIPVQYFKWVGGVLRGDLGQDFLLKRSVASIIFERVPRTVHLGVLAFIISNLLGILFGVICAVKRGSILDSLLSVIANIGITAPSFWVAILMIFIFAFKLHWLPFYGYTSPFDDFWLSTKQLIMPVFCLAIVPMSVIARQTRSSTLEIIRQDYIRTARSKGLRQRTIIFKHTLKNAFIPIITMMGMQVRSIVGGAVFVEVVFNIPGVGRAIIDGVQQQDYLVVQGVVLLLAIITLITNLLVDISYGWFDPRIKY
jgi:peptide/nickel transport system permease protein